MTAKALEFGRKDHEAVATFIDDVATLLEVYEDPAEYWTDLRATNPIELACVTVRSRTEITKNAPDHA